jgi:cyanophycin synthetase
MDILSVQALCGPNLWARVPVLEIRVDVSAWLPLAPTAWAAFQQRLGGWLPGLAARWAAAGPSAAAGSDAPGRELAETLKDVVGELQTRARTPVRFGRVTADEAPGRYRIVVEYEEERLGRACLESARQICVAALKAEDFAVSAELERLVELWRDVCLGTVNGPLVAAARTRGIPFRTMDDNSVLVQLGHGARQHRIQEAVTDRTGRIADRVSTDKELTKKLLSEIGIPVPVGKVVATAEDAWTAACELGLPVAIKPRDADYGNGISLNLTTREQVLAAFALAREFRKEVLVERFAPGEQHRVLVVGDRVIAANRRDPPRVVGDGERTITELIALANRDPRRGDYGYIDRPLWCIDPDEDTPRVLAEQGLTLASVPAAGLEVVLTRLGRIEYGAGVIDVTDLVHPQVAAQCVSAVRLVGLDVAGVDLMAQDISRPLEEQGGVLLEVNSEPSIIFHFPPLCDTYRPVCEAIIESLFPAGETGRIPLAILTGGGDNRTTGRWLARLLQETSQRVGRASSEGLFLDDRRLKPGDQAHLAGSRALLLCPEVEAAVCERSLVSIRREGLGFDFCDVAVVSGLGEDTDPDLLQAARVLVDAGAAVVLDADALAMAALRASQPDAVLLVALRPDHPLVTTHRVPGHRAVYRRGEDLILSAGDRTEQVIAINPRQVPDVDDGARLVALLAGVAAAWALKVPVDVIRTQLSAAML